MKKLCFILTIFSFCNSCSLVHYLSTSDPGIETRKEFNSFISSLTQDTAFSFQIKPEFLDSLSRSKTYCLNLYKFNKGVNASPVQIRMYERSGKLIGGWEQCYGELNYFHLFDSLPIRRIPSHPTNYAITLANDLKMILSDSENEEKIRHEIDSHDYTIILFYAVWAGWYSRDAIKRTVKYVESNPSIFLIYLNTASK